MNEEPTTHTEQHDPCDLVSDTTPLTQRDIPTIVQKVIKSLPQLQGLQSPSPIEPTSTGVRESTPIHSGSRSVTATLSSDVSNPPPPRTSTTTTSSLLGTSSSSEPPSSSRNELDVTLLPG